MPQEQGCLALSDGQSGRETRPTVSGELQISCEAETGHLRVFIAGGVFLEARNFEDFELASGIFQIDSIRNLTRCGGTADTPRNQGHARGYYPLVGRVALCWGS